MPAHSSPGAFSISNTGLFKSPYIPKKNSLKNFLFLAVFFLGAFFALPISALAVATLTPTAPDQNGSGWAPCVGTHYRSANELGALDADAQSQIGNNPLLCKNSRVWILGLCTADNVCTIFRGEHQSAFNNKAETHSERILWTTQRNVARATAVYNSDTGEARDQGAGEVVPRATWSCTDFKEELHETDTNSPIRTTVIRDCYEPTSTLRLITDRHWAERCDVEPVNGVEAQCYIHDDYNFGTANIGPYPVVNGVANVDLTGDTGAPGANLDGEALEPSVVSGRGCDFTDVPCWLLAVVVFLTGLIVALFTGILALISLVFETVVTQFVVEMGKYVTSTTATAVREAWTMVRDLANIAIIGGLIAIGISTIIGSEKVSIQKNLARLLIAALLVNFSYFFAGAIIDASNFIATTAYNQLVRDPVCADTALRDADGGGCGPAGRFLRATQIASWLSDGAVRGSTNTVVGVNARGANTRTGTTVQTRNQASVSGNGVVEQGSEAQTQKIVYNLMNLIFVCITSFVFLSAISLLVARFVALIFLLITSPIGLLGGAVPLLDKYSKEWWDALWSQTMFAPVYFILVGISLNMLDAFKGSLLSGASSGNLLVSSGTNDIIGVIVMFVVAIGFMWVALSVAKEMSSTGRFKDLYKAAETGLGWMPKMYAGTMMGVAKTAGAVPLRYFIGEKLGEGIGMKYADWASKSGLMREGKILGEKTPKWLARMAKPMLGTVDRSIQAQLDAARDAKFFGRPNYDEIYKKKAARQTELDRLEKDQKNEIKAEGTGKEKELRKRKAHLENEKKKGTLTKDGQEELDAINRYQESLKNEGAWAQRVAALEAERKNRRLKPEEKKELADTKRNLDDLRRLEGRFEIGGAIRKRARAERRHREVYNEGLERDIVDEEVARAGIQAKVDAGAAELSPEDEAKLTNLSTERANHLAAGDDISTWTKNAEYERLLGGITSGEKEALADFNERSRTLTPAEKADLATRRKRIENGTAEKEDHEIVAALAKREKGLRPDAFENDGLFRHRQITRADGKGKKFSLEEEVLPDGTKVTKWVEEENADYFERLDLDNNEKTGIGFRTARTEGEEIAQNFSAEYWKRKYRKNHESLIQYAPLMAKKTLGTLIKDHEIREDVRNGMITEVGKPWTQLIIDLDDRVTRGELVRGSPAYDAAKLVPYNYQSNNLKDHELVAEMLMSDASAGVSTLDENGKSLGLDSDGKQKTRNIRMRDMWGKQYRGSLWQSSLSGTFKHFKDNKILGDTALRDARTAKGSTFDARRNEWIGAVDLEGYGEDPEFVIKKGDTVQLDSAVRRDQEVNRKIAGTYGTDEAPGVIKNYLNDLKTRGSSSISEKAYRDAVEEDRWARMMQGGHEKGPLAGIVSDARNFKVIAPMPPLDLQDEAEIINEIATNAGISGTSVSDDQVKEWRIMSRIADIKGITPTEVTNEQIAAFNQGGVLREARNTFEQKLKAGTFGPASNPNITKMSDADFYWYKKIKLEQEMRDLYQGKTPEEIQAIFNRRSYHSPAMSIGIEPKHLVVALDGHDPQERTGILENILKFGDMKLIKELATNEQLRQHFDWPKEDRLRELALIRAGVSGEDLPIDALLQR